MAYAGDRLYNEVIRRKMGDLATKVRVREIVAYLPCLTLSDREEIEAKRETAGNYCAMMVLLDNLRRRENWPDEFISALRTCEQWALADELSEVYNIIRGIHTQRTATAVALAPVPPPVAAAASASPAAPPAHAPVPTAAAPSPTSSPAEASLTVTTATIHNVPHSIPPLLTPSVEASAMSSSPSINSPQGTYPNIAAPVSNEIPALVSAPETPVHPPPESAHPAEPPVSVLAPGARPPSPGSAPTLTPSTGQSEVPVTSRETPKLGSPAASAPINSPPETSALVSAIEASVQAPCEPAQPAEPPLLAPHAVLPSLVSAPQVTPSVGQKKIPVSSRETPTLAISGGLTNTALSGQSPVAAPTLPTNPTSTSSQVNKPATTFQSSAEKSSVPVAVEESSSTVRRPIQETNTPKTVLPQDSQNNPKISQVVERVNTAVSPNCQTQGTSQGTAQASPSASTNAVAGCLSNFGPDNEGNFSKPGVLREEEPFSVSSDRLQISHITMERSAIHPARPQVVSDPHRAEEPVDEPVSVTTGDLMFSSVMTTVPSQRVSDAIAPVQNSTSRTLENAVPEGGSNSYPNDPVEDYYESLQTELGTRVHTVKVSEMPSIQNLNGQPPSMIGSTTIGLSHNGEPESLAQSVSEDQPSQHIQLSQCIQGNNASKQYSPAAGLTTYAEPAPATFQEAELSASGQINIPQSEQRENPQGVLHRFQSNAHLIAAAAIGMIAIFVALKYKQ